MKKSKLLFVSLLILMLTALISCKQANVPGVLPPGVSGNGDTESLITGGIKKLADKNYDGALADFDTAYKNNKNDDKAKFFYALAKMGSISVKPQMATFMKTRLGVKNYPSTMNALLSDSWMKEYKRWVNTRVYNYSLSKPSNPYGGYHVRVTGTVVNTSNGNNYNSYQFHGNDVIQLSDKLYIDGADWQTARSKTLTNLTLNSAGNYFVPVGVYLQVPGNKLDASFSDYWFLSEKELKQLETNQAAKLPEFEKPTWFNLTTAPHIINGQITQSGFWMYLAANALQGNLTGLNGAIVDILSVCFGTEFTEAVLVVNSISDNFVATLTQDQLKAFGLDTVLGEQGITQLKFGKAEILALFGGLELVKGAIETLGSFNLNTDLTFLQADWNNPISIIEKMRAGGWTSTTGDIFNNGFLNRRSDYINRSKASYLAAATKLSSACALYENASSNGNSSMPGIVADYIKPVKLMLGAFQNSVNNNGAFYFPEDGNLLGITTWPTAEDASVKMAVNFSVLFDQNRLTMDGIVELTDSTTGVGKAPVMYKMTFTGNHTPPEFSKVTVSDDIKGPCDGFAIRILPDDISALSPLMGELLFFSNGLYVPICGLVTIDGPNTAHYDLVKFFANYYYGW